VAAAQSQILMTLSLPAETIRFAVAGENHASDERHMPAGIEHTLSQG